MRKEAKKRTVRKPAKTSKPYVICRCSAAGVHAGVLESFDPATASAKLSESRRLWLWRAKQGVTLSDVAIHGAVHDARTKTGAACEIQILGVCEVIRCMPAAEETIRGLP